MARSGKNKLRSWEYPAGSGIRVREIINRSDGKDFGLSYRVTIRHGITVSEIASSFHPYLTLSEGMKLAALSFGKDVRKLSCCAA